MKTFAATFRAGPMMLLALLFPAAVAPFVPFTGGYSPFLALRENRDGLTLLAAPFFLGLPLVFWHARRLIVRGATLLGRRSIYLLSGSSALVSLFFSSLTLRTLHVDWPGIVTMIMAPTACGSLWWWLCRNAPVDERPSAALALAYLTNMVLPVVVFAREAGIGWWLTLVASTGLVAQLVGVVLRVHIARQLQAAESIFRVIDPALPFPRS